MNKKLAMFFLSCMFTGFTLAQGVGINTDNPKGILHVDGAGDNKSATPTATELANDVVIGSDGKMAIGQLPDATNTSILQVNGSISVNANIAESPKDGVTYVLASTDGSLNAKWLQNVALSPTVIGVLGTDGSDSTTVPPDGVAKDGYAGAFLGFDVGSWTGAWIKLPPGSWIIQSSILLYTAAAPSSAQSVWARLSWSSSKDAGRWDSTDVIAGRYVSGVVPPTNTFGLAVGTTLITNKSGADKVYYLNMNWSTSSGGFNTTWKNVGSSQWSENTIVAYPVISL
ncbi:hypothetical protein O2K51_10495 [Apibacter raozihei]|uniref:hypothetical protein n=1 Tax=Apibacter raozihei TaxID=2500547 RepID=UPI000FE3B2E9|nr:hypothetical protein [Apibacter raozihei]